MSNKIISEDKISVTTFEQHKWKQHPIGNIILLLTNFSHWGPFCDPHPWKVENHLRVLDIVSYFTIDTCVVGTVDVLNQLRGEVVGTF